MTIAIFCFVSVVGFVYASNPDLTIDDARNVAIDNVNNFIGIGSKGIVVQTGTYFNDTNTYSFPVVDMNSHKIIGNIFVNGDNGICTTDFLTKDSARSQIANYIKINFPNNGDGFVPQTPIYMSNVHDGDYGFKVPVVDFNSHRRLFILYIDGKTGLITD